MEVPAALWRKNRLGELSAEAASGLSQAFELDFRSAGDTSPRFAVVKIGTHIVNVAARLVATQALRASDAIQLATALAVRELEPECRTIACFDKQLRSAAAAHGFELIP